MFELKYLPNSAEIPHLHLMVGNGLFQIVSELNSNPVVEISFFRPLIEGTRFTASFAEGSRVQIYPFLNSDTVEIKVLNLKTEPQKVQEATWYVSRAEFNKHLYRHGVVEVAVPVDAERWIDEGYE